MIQGLNYLASGASDLDRTKKLLVELLGAFEVIPSCPKSDPQEIILRIGDVWLKIVKSDDVSSKATILISFNVHPTDFDWYLEEINKRDLQVANISENTEKKVRSIRFCDYDGNRFELNTNPMPSALLQSDN